MHVIAGKAVALKEALEPEFKTYQNQIVKNAKTLAEELVKKSFRLVSGGTDNHLMLVDVNKRGLTGKECAEALDRAAITVNKNTIPFDTQSPFKAGGIRLGTPAVTTRGMKEKEMVLIAGLISDVLSNIHSEPKILKAREAVTALTRQFPLYAEILKRLKAESEVSK